MNAIAPAFAKRSAWLSRGIAALFLVFTVPAMSIPAWAAPTPDSFADLADKVLPAVVNISTTQTVKGNGNEGGGGLDIPQFPPGSPFDEFFKNFMERQGQGQGQRDAAPRKVTALGSGFIIDPSGLVVTNNHVIADADQITVILHDEQAFKAKLLGRDTRADLALLKIDAPNPLPFLPIGNSDAMRVGDWVIAIGNPYGLGGSVTQGIISARERSINAGPFDDFIQTDAAINKGNSGGPLINLKGEVIGINAAIYSPSGGSIGIGFSIPANQAKPVLADLQKYGKPRRGWLGVRIQSLTDDIADGLGLKDKKGALIAQVTPNGPGAKAGIKQGDVVEKFDGKDIPDMRSLPRIVAQTPIDKQVDVTLLRDGKQITVKATVGELPEEEEKPETKTSDSQGSKRNNGSQTQLASLGLTVSPISQALRERYDIDAGTKGVVVTDVKSGSAGQSSGIRQGDVISEVAQAEVTSPADLVSKIDAQKKAGHRTALLLLQNESGPHYVPLRLTPAPAARTANANP